MPVDICRRGFGTTQVRQSEREATIAQGRFSVRICDVLMHGHINTNVGMCMCLLGRYRYLR